METFDEKRALTGIRVVDLSRVIAGPHCSMILGDFGADVVKVEKKDSGDNARVYAPYDKGLSTYFMAHNRNKRSVTLDFRHPRANEILLGLLKNADVLVENYKAGTLEQMGLAPEKLLELNPRLIITRISGFGQTGPYVSRTCYDSVAQSISGLMSVNGEPDRPPVMIGIYVCDFVSGIYAALGTMAALKARETSGKGQVVDVALLDVACSLTHNAITDYCDLGLEMPRTGNQDRFSWPATFYFTKDNKQMYIHTGMDPMFAKFCSISGNQALLSDERYRTLDGRRNHVAECDAYVAKWCAELTSEEVVKQCEQAGIPYAKVNGIAEMTQDPQVLFRKMVRHMEHPVLGPVTLPGPPLKLSDTNPDVYLAPPVLGQHTGEVYRDWLGYGDEQLRELTEQGVI